MDDTAWCMRERKVLIEESEPMPGFMGRRLATRTQGLRPEVDLIPTQLVGPRPFQVRKHEDLVAGIVFVPTLCDCSEDSCL
jgi:hypothetical protein